MSRVIHFEIPAADPERASKFCQKVFGLMKNTDVKTTTNTIGVDSVDASVEAVTKAGGKLVMPKTAIPTVGYFAYLTDTEGNLFGVMQTDKSAK
jgi:uncharacterized protein